MHIVKRIMKKLKAWRNHVDIEKVQALSGRFRKEMYNNEALELLKSKDFENLTNVAVYADLGVWTAIQAAFCMGYEVGKEDLKNHLLTNFGAEAE